MFIYQASRFFQYFPHFYIPSKYWFRQLKKSIVSHLPYAHAMPRRRRVEPGISSTFIHWAAITGTLLVHNSYCNLPRQAVRAVTWPAFIYACALSLSLSLSLSLTRTLFTLYSPIFSITTTIFSHTLHTFKVLISGNRRSQPSQGFVMLVLHQEGAGLSQRSVISREC